MSKHLGYPLPTVYKYLRELEAARIAESEVKGNVRLYYVSDFKLVISPERLMRAFEGQSVLDVYKGGCGSVYLIFNTSST